MASHTVRVTSLLHAAHAAMSAGLVDMPAHIHMCLCMLKLTDSPTTVSDSLPRRQCPVWPQHVSSSYGTQRFCVGHDASTQPVPMQMQDMNSRAQTGPRRRDNSDHRQTRAACRSCATQPTRNAPPHLAPAAACVLSSLPGLTAAQPAAFVTQHPKACAPLSWRPPPPLLQPAHHRHRSVLLPLPLPLPSPLSSPPQLSPLSPLHLPPHSLLHLHHPHRLPRSRPTLPPPSAPPLSTPPLSPCPPPLYPPSLSRRHPPLALLLPPCPPQPPAPTPPLQPSCCCCCRCLRASPPAPPRSPRRARGGWSPAAR